MKLYIMTDLESAAGVGPKADWTVPDGAHYEEARALLTGEANAAVEALFAAGATEVHVADGHGCGGIRPDLLDGRAVLYNRWEPPYYPFKLDGSFDGVLFIGQHAKAGTLHAHLPHTGSHHVLDRRINGRSVGEYGGFAMMSYFLGVPVIFGSGDKAFTKEAKDLVPNIVTVAVKEGKNESSGEEYCFETYDGLFGAHDSLPPEEAQKAISEGVRQAMLLLLECGKEYFAPRGMPVPPYHMVLELRKSGGDPARALLSAHESDPIALFIEPMREIYKITHRGTQKRREKPVWCSLGDSITFRNSWQPAVADALELTHVNCGVGSTTVALPFRCVTRPAFCTDRRLGLGEFANVKQLISDDGAPYAPVLAHSPHVITIFGGPNDTVYTKAAGGEEELAKPPSEKDLTVFYGAYSYIVETLLARRPQAKIFLMTMFPMSGGNQLPETVSQDEGNRAIRRIAAHYGLPVIDLEQELAQWKTDFLPFLPDGVHPNAEGGRRIAEIVIRVMNPALLEEDESGCIS